MSANTQTWYRPLEYGVGIEEFTGEVSASGKTLIKKGKWNRVVRRSDGWCPSILLAQKALLSRLVRKEKRLTQSLSNIRSDIKRLREIVGGNQ